MPKKLKLNLNDLKVQSFVTALNDMEKMEFVGGTSDGGDECPPTCFSCPATVCQTCGVSCTTGCSGGQVCCWN